MSFGLLARYPYENSKFSSEYRYHLRGGELHGVIRFHKQSEEFHKKNDREWGEGGKNLGVFDYVICEGLRTNCNPLPILHCLYLSSKIDVTNILHPLLFTVKNIL